MRYYGDRTLVTTADDYATVMCCDSAASSAYIENVNFDFNFS